MKFYNYLFILFLLPITFAYSQPKISGINLISTKISQYQKTEWNIKIDLDFTNPFDQNAVKLDMFLNSPSGKSLLLPCYFDSKAAIWKARFAPQEIGKYRYHFKLTDTSGSEESQENYFTVHPTAGSGFLHKNDLWTFKFDNGNLFRGIGENIGWESRSFENPKWTYDYLLARLAKNGTNFFRTWMCSWNLPLEWQKVHSTKRYTDTKEYFNPGAIKRMDELVDLADSLKLYFMLTLDWHGELIAGGDWNGSPYNVKNGGPASTPTEFLTLQSAREKYKNKLRYVVARWGYSTSIAAFEFFNEIDNAAFTSQDSLIIPEAAITQWHMEMSRYLKDIDPYQHMVTTSISHRDIMGLNSIAYIDFNQKHIYKHTEKIPAIYPDYIQTYGKPYVIGEFGYRWEDDDPKYAKEDIYDFKRGLWYGLFSETPILPMSWWWELFDNLQMTYYFEGVRKISDQMLKAGKGSFKRTSIYAGKKEAYSVKCGETYFAYLLNNTDVVDSGAVLMLVSENNYSIQSYNPSNNQYHDVDYSLTADGSLQIKNLILAGKKELILILTEIRKNEKKNDSSHLPEQ